MHGFLRLELDYGARISVQNRISVYCLVYVFGGTNWFTKNTVWKYWLQIICKPHTKHFICFIIKIAIFILRKIAVSKETLILPCRSLRKLWEFDSNILEHLIYQFAKFPAFPFSKLWHPALRCPHLAVSEFVSTSEMVRYGVGWRTGVGWETFRIFPHQLRALGLLHAGKYPW